MSTLTNFFRSVILLSPSELVQCVYLCLNKVQLHWNMCLRQGRQQYGRTGSNGRAGSNGTTGMAMAVPVFEGEKMALLGF